MADVKFEVVSFALSTAAATNTQDVTISGFGTPSAAIFILSGGVTDDTVAAGGAMGIGFTDGTRQKAVSMNIADAAATTNTGKSHSNACITQVDVGGATTNFEFSFNSWITDGVRLTIDTQAASAYLCTCILIGGADVANAYVNELGLGTATSAIDVTAPGFQPDLVLMTSVTSSTALDANTTNAIFNFGVGHNDGSDTQRCSMISSRDNRTESECSVYISNQYIAGQAYNAVFSYGATIGGYDASGFSITPTASAGDDIVFYLALKFNNSPGVDLFDMTWPTTGDYGETTPSFRPAFGLISTITSGVTGRDAIDSGGVFGNSIAAFDGNSIAVINATDEDAAGTTVAKSMHSNQLRIRAKDNTDAVIASSYAFDSLGWDFTLSTNPAATELGWALAIEQSGADTTSPVLTSPGTSSITAVAAQGDVTTDEGNGTLYFVVSEDSGTPSVAQIQAGNDANGSAGVDSGNQAVSGTGAQAVSITGLTHNTDYYVTFQHQDAATNDSTVTAPSSFSTDEITATSGGTAANVVESVIVSTGGTITITLVEDTFIAAGTGPIGTTAQSNTFVAAFTSAQSEGTGWNATVRDVLDNTDLTRTSNTVATLTIPATAGFDITATETITPVVQAAILTLSVGNITASSFTVSPTVVIGPGGGSNVARKRRRRRAIRAAQ